MGFFGKKAAVAVEEPASKAAPAMVPSRKLWGVLLVLSIVMVFIFGGAVAGLLYMRVATPPLSQVPPRPSKKKAAADAPPKLEAPKAEPAKAEAPMPEEPKATKAVETKASDRPTGSPAVHAAALPKRSAEPIATAAKLEKAAPAPVSAKPAGGKVRAVAVEFSHPAPSAKEVQLRGAFLVRTGGKQAMVKDAGGVWKLSLSLLPGSYKYSFIVDGKRTPNESKQVQ